MMSVDNNVVDEVMEDFEEALELLSKEHATSECISCGGVTLDTFHNLCENGCGHCGSHKIIIQLRKAVKFV